MRNYSFWLGRQEDPFDVLVRTNPLKEYMTVGWWKPAHNPISNPAHYHAGRKHSPDEVIEDWGLGFRLGNVVKYVSRAGRKGPALPDLRKAQDYLAKEIASLEAKERAP